MKKTNTKKDINIFAILGIILVLLIVALIAFTTIQKATIQNKVNKYIEHEYGEKGRVKMFHSVGTNDYGQQYDIWVTEDSKYMYSPADNTIYDSDKGTARNTAATEAIKAYSDAHAEDGYTVSNVSYITYTDADDVTKDYNAIIIYPIATDKGTVASTDEAAELAWSYITAYENYEELTGVEVSVYDMENEYTIYVDPFENTSVTLDALKENSILSTEKSYMYQIWKAGIEAAVEDEAADTAEDDTAEDGATEEGEENTDTAAE